MSENSEKDNLYQDQQGMSVDFVFDEKVAKVFPDMIRRSVPGYDTLITLIGLFAGRFTQPNSRLYDLGCSWGAVTLALRRHITQDNCRIIAVDSAVPMVERCRKNISNDTGKVPVDVVRADLREIPIKEASLVVMNFTLQFLAPDERLEVLAKIHTGLLPGGALILSEKIKFRDEAEQLFNEAMHLDFKRTNDYSDLEISRKRTALEKILIPDNLPAHMEHLQAAGFSSIYPWFQAFNFVSMVAIK